MTKMRHIRERTEWAYLDPDCGGNGVFLAFGAVREEFIERFSGFSCV